MTEIRSRQIPDFPGYSVSANGCVWTHWKFRGKGKGYVISDMHWHQLQSHDNSERDHHQKVTLYRGGKRFHLFVHLLVMQVFVGPCPVGYECRHLDGDPTNNQLGNLCYGTRLENRHDRKRHGTESEGERSGKTKLRTADVLRATQLAAKGHTRQQIADLLNTPKSTISGILRGRTWSHVTGIQHVGKRKLKART